MHTNLKRTPKRKACTDIPPNHDEPTSLNPRTYQGEFTKRRLRLTHSSFFYKHKQRKNFPLWIKEIESLCQNAT